MPIETVLPLVIGISLLSLAVAWVLARQVLAADTGTPAMRQISDAIREGAEAFLSRQYRTIGMLSIVAAAAIFGFYFFNRDVKNIEEMGVGTFWKVTLSFLIGRPVLRDRRLHRHVRLDPRQHPHRHRRDDEPQQGPPARAARGRRLRPRRGLHEPARRGRPVLAVRRDARLPARAAPDRRLRLRRELRRPLRPARRRDLHQGGRRRRRPRRQGRGGHPRGRPAQPGGHRGPRGRQRRRLRRPRRRPLRVDGGREHRRHDPRHRALPGVRPGRDPLPAPRPRLRPDRHDRRRLHGQDAARTRTR